MRARVGKIARLPESIREELNQRLLNGVMAQRLTAWLNELPEVKHIVTDQFAGYPVSEHNISEWRRGGYLDWLRKLETRERLLHITDHCQDPATDAQLRRQMERFMTAELLDATNELDQLDPNARWQRLRKISRELARLQNVHCRGLEAQLKIEKQTHPSNALAPTRTY